MTFAFKRFGEGRLSSAFLILSKNHVLANDTPSEFKKQDPSQHQHTQQRFLFPAYKIIRLIHTDMEARLIVAVVFICAVCRFTEAQLQNTTALTSNITLTGCGSTKMCVSSPTRCDPAGNSGCYFMSTQLNKAVLTVELSGTTSGYVALGLKPTIDLFGFNGTVVFVCGNNNNNNNSGFFETATQNGPVLTPANLTALNIPNVQGSVLGNVSVQCVFNVTFTSTLITSFFTISSVPLSSTISIFNGNTTGTDLGNATTLITTGPFDLANPKSNIPTFNINRTGCNSTKLCVSSASTCDPAGSSSCFFASFQVNNQNTYYELSGTTSGYVALELLNNQNASFVFVCANNAANGTFFFQTATKNGSSLSLTTVNTVNSNQGFLQQNLIQCVFNTSATLSTKAANTVYTLSLMSGTTKGTQLGDPIILYTSPSALDLSNPNGVISASTNLCTNVLAVLLAAMTLHLL
ncbi:hypothetical protein AMELA_G00066580 [Ameiurus melas]|uniref:Ferric-chelate reductase 1 n=1 Tax=Ameiurus melas TaxID=219545 RepID=A0A7J6B4U4_AMEME|nr:hypothetical protein AMELA_G00066580 [Ameiurus melas]